MCNVIYMTYTLLCDSKIMEKIIVSYLSDYKKVNDDNPDFFVVDEAFLILKGFVLKDFFSAKPRNRKRFIYNQLS